MWYALYAMGGKETQPTLLNGGDAMRKRLLQRAADEAGLSIEEMLEESVYDACTGICRRCNSTQEVEPDATDNWCYGCEDHTVVSVLILAGLI